MKKVFLIFFCFVTFCQSLTQIKPKSFDDVLCRDQLTLFTNALTNRDFWALELFDTWAKIQDGYLSGNNRNLGNFDYCVRFRYETQSIGIIQGQHCHVAYRALPNSTLDTNNNGFDWREL